MYLENKDKNNHTMSSADVKEATEALKGMLGIGKNRETPVKNASKPNRPKSRSRRKADSPRRHPKSGDEPNESFDTGKGKRKKEKPKKENFAWSAFQSTPDASALPIPAFSSTELGEPVPTPPEADKLSALLVAAGTNQTSNPEQIANATRAEDLEAQVIAEAEKAAAKAKDNSEKEEDEKQEDCKTEQHIEVVKAEMEEKSEDPDVSKSGINLAEIAASPLSKGKDETPQFPNYNANLPPNPAHFNAPAPNGFSSQSQFVNNSMPQHGHGQPQTHFLPPPPTGYVTIPVSVPPVLMPGRRMLVPTPAGYPVQIIVPEGVPPGMVIPARVPAQSMMQNSYGYPPPANPGMPYNMMHPSSTPH